MRIVDYWTDGFVVGHTWPAFLMMCTCMKGGRILHIVLYYMF